MSTPNAIRRAWAPGSRMAKVPLEATPANLAGRARVVDGMLTRSSKTRDIDPRAPDPDIVVDPDFLSVADCDRLLEVFDDLHHRLRGRKVGIDFWEGRIVYLNEVLAHDREAAAIMAGFQKRTTERLREHYALTRPLWTDTVQLNIWTPGGALPPHTDNSNPDGSPHPSFWRDFSSVVYLNDDYEGGELYFTAKDAVLRPSRGMLAAFSAWPGHEHGVLKVTGGRRVTMPAFYTFWPAKADRTIYPELFAVTPSPTPGAAPLRSAAGPKWTPPRLS